MDSGVIIDVFRQMLYLVVMGVSIIVIPGLIVGLIVAIFQAATQINEMTLSFLPKLVITIMVIAFLAPWLVHYLSEYIETLISDIPYMIR
ncbi:MAG: flagellar biosynthesis protein FliQ [Legionellales bacterium]|nr:flagellar biosynthesis protein FliQ [Legionellales bacterium]